jgi:hypothetical protein
MFFNNPYERLRQSALTVSDLPGTLTKLQAQGALSELASLLYSIYRCEHDQVFGEAIRASQGKPNVSQVPSSEEVAAYERMGVFK